MLSIWKVPLCGSVALRGGCGWNTACMNVYLVWHIHHATWLDGSPTEHFSDDGVILLDEQSGDDAKMLGVYATQEAAQARIDRARTQPGFEDEPGCFLIDTATLDHDLWTEGYVMIRD